MENLDFSIRDLGERPYPSPIGLSRVMGDLMANYVSDGDMVLPTVDAIPGARPSYERGGLLEKAGPRETIRFAGENIRAAIVSCGGLCPGINDVIRSLVRCLWYRYGVRSIAGIRFGYRGFLPGAPRPPMALDPEVVDDIHKIGGSVLGTSRGEGERTAEIVDAIAAMGIKALFTIGGDGTQKGSLAIAEEARRRGMELAVVGIPKTIDNDIFLIDKTFGFETAVEMATLAVVAAHTEAHSAVNGIGLVKLMGRESGFIAAHTALAAHEANFVLVPEVPFELEGPRGLLRSLEVRLAEKNHAVVIVAEGAGQELLAPEKGADASGNKRLADIGLFLKERISAHFAAAGTDASLKYIDPSYIVRSAPANPLDAVYCDRLGANAAHAAMAGKTELIIGLVNGEFVHVPTSVAVSRRKRMDPESALWRDVVDSTRQPALMTGRRP
jgi:6-phosphofructokinase 1